jgi:nucleoside-diphosphate kinase
LGLLYFLVFWVGRLSIEREAARLQQVRKGILAERTLVLVKPDGVERGLVGEIISRFEKRTLKIVAMKMITADEALAKRHYDVHRDKPFFRELVEFITSGPTVAMVLEGQNAIGIVRSMIGALQPAEAQAGTIRGDFTLEVQRNLVHGSDSRETAEREIPIWFEPGELT